MNSPRLGWDAGWDAARVAAAEDARELQAVRIASEHRGAYRATDDAATGWVELTGKAFRAAADKRALPTTGDWVLVERWAAAIAGDGAAVIRAILPRRTLLVRRAAGEATAPQPLVANADVGLVLTSANGDLSPARLDRYLALLRDGGIAPVLVLSKIDLVADPAPALAALAVVGGEGTVVLALSTVTGVGVAEVRAIAGVGRTAVLLGSSGVGKSSLLNELLGSAAQLTQQIRDDERGRHTTTGRELFVTDTGVWIDTPGMRELAQWVDDGAAPEAAAFDDVVAAAEGCRFRDCGHRDEPGCAVRGKVEPARLASFHKLADERRGAQVRQSVAQRIAARRRKPMPGHED